MLHCSHARSLVCMRRVCSPHTSSPGLMSAGYYDCEAQTAGCETQTANDVNHCGVCGNKCPVPNGGSATCTGGVCGNACPSGVQTCHGKGTGAGTCCLHHGSRSGSRPVGVEWGGPELKGAIPRLHSAGLTLCGSTCCDLKTDAQHCGSCGQTCAFPNAVASCVNNECTMGACVTGKSTQCSTGFATAGIEGESFWQANTCQFIHLPSAPGPLAGFSKCDSNPGSGCETYTATDIRNCGCGNASVECGHCPWFPPAVDALHGLHTPLCLSLACLFRSPAICL